MRSVILLVILFSRITPQYFLDITDESGTEVSRHQSSFFGAGATMVDFDQDGFDDIIVPTPDGNTFKLFKNNGDQTFFDVAGSIGFENENAESINILVADYDNDGYNDFFIVNWFETSRLYHNDGDNTFTDVTESAGINVLFTASRSACWLDYNRDGYIDLYMVNRENSEYNILYHNNGDGTFDDMTDSAGIDGTEGKMGLVVIAFDYNNDLWPDIYIGNDLDTGNIFYHNNGDGTFTDISIHSGLGLEFNTMGVTAEDYDNDGDLDIYMTNVDDPGNALMRNNGDGTFTDVAGTLGITVELIGWGVNFFDFDNDGDIDLYVANGCISGTALDGELGCSWNSGFSTILPHTNILFSNNGDGTFSDVSNDSGLNNSYLTTGTAIGDINNDGFYDIYEVNELDMSTSSNHCRLYKNNFNESNPGIRWVKVKLEGVASNRNAIGSRIYISQQEGVLQQIREINSGESYSSQSSYTASFGMGSLALIDTLKISWPSGLVQYHYNILPNQTHYIVEGQDSDESICLFRIDRENLVNGLDCEGVCGGLAVVDECGICGGDGSDNQGCGCFEEGPSGCDNTCDSDLENDTCGVCGGDGSDNQGCGCFEDGPSGCDNTCGSDLENDTCGVCGGEGSDDQGCGCFEDGPSGCDNTCGSTLVDDECGVCNGDNSTCTGCTNETATNYNLNATIDDNSCEFLDIYLDEIPDKLAIIDTYPNPFNSNININFSIPVLSKVLLKIYNIDGKLVDTLVDSNLQPGYFNITWEAHLQSSGIYFIQIASEDDLIIKRVTLLK